MTSLLHHSNYCPPMQLASTHIIGLGKRIVDGNVQTGAHHVRVNDMLQYVCVCVCVCVGGGGGGGGGGG